MERALEGIRVADLSHVLAAPTTSMILADLGAEVIHIEPAQGDDAREYGPFLEGQSGYFISINRNKKSIVVDLKKPAGKEVMRDLVRCSDVVLENFRPDTMARLGFSWEQIQAINPRAIYAAICGFGHDALPEYASKPAYDMIAQAASGLMSITGPEGGPPVRVGASVGDTVAGHQCAIAILAALRHRDRTGRGQKIDIAMVDGLVYILENAIVRYTVSGRVPGPIGTAHPAITPFQGFQTRDGWIIIAVGNDAMFRTLCKAVELPFLADHPDYCTNPQRTEHRTQLAEALQARFCGKTTAEWTRILEEHKLPYSPINTIDKVVEDANLRHRKMIVEIDQPEAGRMKIVGSPFHLSETPGEVYAPAPLLGQHTEEVLERVLGYSALKVEELRKAGAVYARTDLAGDGPAAGKAKS